MHRVEARRLADHEARRPEGAPGEGVAAVGAMGELEALAETAEGHRVLAHHVARAEGEDADLVPPALAGEGALSTHHYLFALVDGGGNVAPELSAAGRLVGRGHAVTVLAEDSVAVDVRASGAAFRRWERVRVRAGTRLRTGIGVVEVLSVRISEVDTITQSEARRAGYPTLAELIAELAKFGNGPVHRVEFRFAGADPRLALRAQSELSATELTKLRRRLARLDDASRHGPWTRSVLL